MATPSSTRSWKIPWTEKPGRLQSMGSQRVGHDWATSLSLYTLTNTSGTLLRFHLFLASGTELGTVFVIISTVTPDLTLPTHLVDADRKWGVKVKIADWLVSAHSILPPDLLLESLREASSRGWNSKGLISCNFRVSVTYTNQLSNPSIRSRAGLSWSKITSEVSNTFECSSEVCSLQQLLQQCLSNFTGHCNHLGACWKADFEAVGLDRGTRCCRSNEPSSDSAAAVPTTTLKQARPTNAQIPHISNIQKLRPQVVTNQVAEVLRVPRASPPCPRGTWQVRWRRSAPG